jgi:Zn-dependent protease
VIFALRHPAVLLGLFAGFLIGVVAKAIVQRWLVSGSGLRRRGRLRSVRSGGRSGFPQPSAGWSSYLDPYGAVAAVLAGAGWGARVQGRRSGRGSDVALLLAGLVVHGALAVAGAAAFNAAGGDYRVFGSAFFDATSVLHGSVDPPTTQAITAGFALINVACGLLVLLPIPPLELGVILWSRLPRSPGARRFSYHLLEEQWGVAVVLLFLLLPLAGQQPLLLVLINDASRAIFAQF